MIFVWKVFCLAYHHPACIHDKYFIRIHDCVQSVGYCQHCALLKFSSDGSLDEGICSVTMSDGHCISLYTFLVINGQWKLPHWTDHQNVLAFDTTSVCVHISHIMITTIYSENLNCCWLTYWFEGSVVNLESVNILIGLTAIKILESKTSKSTCGWL